METQSDPGGNKIGFWRRLLNALTLEPGLWGMKVNLKELFRKRGVLPETKRPSGRDSWDVFISHASEDTEVAGEIAKGLEALGYSVWFDQEQLKVGDSLRASIDKGLRGSRYGVVLLSPNYLREGKKWTKLELSALVSLQDDDERVILPVWHELNSDDVKALSPVLSDLKAVSTSDGIEAVISAIHRAAQGPVRGTTVEGDAGEVADDRLVHFIEGAIRDKIRLAAALMNRSAWQCNFPENYLNANGFEMISTQFPELPESEAEKVTMLRGALHFERNMKYWLEQSLDVDNLLEAVAAATEQSYRRPQYRAATMIEFLRGRHVSQFCEQWLESGGRGSLAVSMIKSAASGTLLRFFEVDLAAKEPENGRLAVAAYHATRAQLEGLRRRGVFSEEND